MPFITHIRIVCPACQASYDIHIDIAFARNEILCYKCRSDIDLPDDPEIQRAIHAYNAAVLKIEEQYRIEGSTIHRKK